MVSTSFRGTSPNMVPGEVVKGGDGHNDYILQWLDAHTSRAIVDNESSTGDEDDQGCVHRLYQLCLRALQDLYRQERDQCSSSSRSFVLGEYLGRLHLWGEPFGAGELDKALSQSDELRDSVLERLVHIGKLLLHGNSLGPRMDFCPHG